MVRRVVVALMLLCVVVAVSAQNTTEATSNWKTYRNQQSRFELKYPADWKVSEASGTGAQMITIAGPRSAGGPQLSLTVAVQKDQNPKKLSVQEWFAEQLKRVKTKPEAQGSTEVGTEPAIFMDNTNSFGKRRAVYLVLHGKDIVTFLYEPGTKFDSAYESILGSFRAF